MKKDDIISLPDVRLRKKSQSIQAFGKETKQLISDMEHAVIDWEESRPHEVGVALAAVQVGIMKRAIIVRSGEDKADPTFTAYINPEIVKKSGKKIYDYEGCLSVKDVYGHVGRYEKVTIKAQTLKGKTIRFDVEGFKARILQHEIDHTNGFVFPDRLDDREKLFVLDKDGTLKPAHETKADTDYIFRD